MKLNFKINKYYLLIHALKQTREPFISWAKFQDKIWKKFPRGYYLYSWYSDAAFIDIKSPKDFGKIFKEAGQLIKNSFRFKEFKRLYKETQKYLFLVKKEWERNKEK